LSSTTKSTFKGISSTKLSKHDVRDPDAMTQELKKGFEWTRHHVNLVLIFIGVFIVAGASWTAYNYASEQAETKAQESYFKAEKAFLKKRDSFAPQKPEMGEKPAEPAVSSGNFETDFADSLPAMNKIITDFPNSAASKMAALLLASEAMQYKNFAYAQKTLSEVKLGSDLLSAMVLLETGKAIAGSGNCAYAQDFYNRALFTNKASVIAPDIHLQQGLCFEATGEKVKAEESYNKVLAESKESPFAHSAENYLRLMHQ
jgi:predicted negative regulator of RcsB-dependent stress response